MARSVLPAARRPVALRARVRVRRSRRHPWRPRRLVLRVPGFRRLRWAASRLRSGLRWRLRPWFRRPVSSAVRVPRSAVAVALVAVARPVAERVVPALELVEKVLPPAVPAEPVVVPVAQELVEKVPELVEVPGLVEPAAQEVRAAVVELVPAAVVLPVVPAVPVAVVKERAAEPQVAPRWRPRQVCRPVPVHRSRVRCRPGLPLRRMQVPPCCWTPVPSAR
ncbi:hypothetical protein [Mycolicibacterium fluoranthenivorans]|uniref:Uncharacterized protein n=1 Tax=Mycolicibacterium fluoranthenivorans TaxID=258505 RepID=A0A1G4V5C6_9MYCO|nr:hypothetical protein [Mycolicibacterium fluoranthenivorans]SCX01450.1 hypothetical protein SAMN02799620_00268 [Mycolicibacterium fluoranthenivorans]